MASIMGLPSCRVYRQGTQGVTLPSMFKPLKACMAATALSTPFNTRIPVSDRFSRPCAKCCGWAAAPIGAEASFPLEHSVNSPFSTSRVESSGKRVQKTRSITEMSTGAIALPTEYGYVLFVLFASILVHHFYMAFGVTGARKK